MQQLGSKGLAKIKFSICGMGIPARSKHEAGKDAHPTRKFWVFFYLEVPKFQGIVGAGCRREVLDSL